MVCVTIQDTNSTIIIYTTIIITLKNLFNKNMMQVLSKSKTYNDKGRDGTVRTILKVSVIYIQ